MKKSKNKISNWLAKHGDPEIDKKVDKELMNMVEKLRKEHSPELKDELRELQKKYKKEDEETKSLKDMTNKLQLYTQDDLIKAINLAQDPITMKDEMWGLYNVYRTVGEIIEQINLERLKEDDSI